MEMEMWCAPSTKMARLAPPPTSSSGCALVVEGARGRDGRPPRANEHGGESGPDIISSLLDAVLGEIVSCLPTKDGVCMQVLASRWQPLWRTAPMNLDCREICDARLFNHLETVHIETTSSRSLCSKELVRKNHSGNLFSGEPVADDAKRLRVDCDEVDDESCRLYDWAPQFLEIVISTKEQLGLHYGLVDNVDVFSVSRNLFLTSFCVAYALHDYLGDWSFKVANHLIKDEVVVKFDNLFSVNVVHGKNFKQGASTNNYAVMMATKVVGQKPCKPDWFRLTKTQIIRHLTSSDSVFTVDAGTSEAPKPGASGSA
ncbi:hypothetical protein ZWY2020_022720 [Hordeum vulgare]|nr:hypothetical protein ZWY2020_022720 [Hordeum vulgare]